MIKGRNSIRKGDNDSVRAYIFGVPSQTLADDKMNMRDNVYDLTEEVQKGLSSTVHTREILKNFSENVLVSNFINDVRSSGIGGKFSKRKTLIYEDLLKNLKKN